MYTVSQYKDSVAGILSGVNINLITDLNGAIQRAARTLVQKADIPEASNIQNIILYDGVFNYPCDTRIFGTAIIDIRPQGNTRNPWDSATKIYGEQFDRNKNLYPSGTSSTFEFSNGIPIIRIQSNQPLNQVILDSCQATTGWTTGGTISNLTTSQAIYYQDNASLRFTLGSGTGNLSKTLSTQNLSTYQNVGVAFIAIEIPSGSINLTNISLRIGSSSSNYSTVTSSAPFIGSFQDSVWMLIPFDFSTATNVGSPNWNSINYIDVVFNASSNISNIYIGDLFISLPSPAQILFQTAAIFLASGSSTPSVSITNNSDQIILNDAAYNIFQYEGALSILLNTGGGSGDAMTARIENILNGARARNGTVITQGLYDLYRGDNPSQELRQTESWYDVNNGGTYNYNGRV